MNRPVPYPPRLTMDQYADWVASNLKNQDPERIRRQKEIEEQLTMSFHMWDQDRDNRLTTKPAAFSTPALKKNDIAFGLNQIP